jgi:hypothetical protein
LLDQRSAERSGCCPSSRLVQNPRAAPITRTSASEFELNGGIRVWFRGTRDGADVKFSGIESPAQAERSFSRETLAEDFSERIDVVTLAGDDYIILVSSDCDAATTL